jgi:hypothetical protein
MKTARALLALLFTRLLSDSDSDSGDSGSGESGASSGESSGSLGSNAAGAGTAADSALFLSSGGPDPNQHGSSYYSSDTSPSSDDPATRRAARTARGQPTDPAAQVSAGDLQDIPPG